VKFGTVTAASVVIVDAFTLTCTIPVGLVFGTVDITVTINGEVGTLPQGFLYYGGSITAVKPGYMSLAGGAVVIEGSSFQTGSTFTFGGVAASGVTFIDDSHYAVTAPPHAVGTVDVIMTESGGATATLTNGFQYTELTRANDIRRQPGITVSEAMGSQANRAGITVDGRSNRPVAGEEIHITDEFTSRVLFGGIVQTVEQIYEDRIDQIAWACSLVDYTFFLNRRRPFGTYTNVSVSEIVLDLMGKYAPGFSTAYVQTKLGLLTISFDGTRTLSECLDVLAQAIGGGRWYLDYSRVLHFFHPPIPDDIIIPITTGGGADFTPARLSTGAALNSTVHFQTGYYAVRCSFIYSNGTESRLGPASNVFPYSGANFMHIGSLPIGANPSGTITCVKRKIYFLRGNEDLASGWTVNDNVTTDIEVTPDLTQVDTPTVTVDVGDPVTIDDGGGIGTTPQVPMPGAGDFGIPMVQQISGSGHGLLIAGNISGVDAGSFANGFHLTGAATAGIWQFKMSATYQDGTETAAGQPSNPVYWGEVAIGTGGAQISFTYPDGTVFRSRGFDAWIPQALDAGGAIFPDINGRSPILFNIYASLWKRVVVTQGGVGADNFVEVRGLNDDSGYSLVGSVPYHRALSPTTHNPLDPTTGNPIDTTIPIPPVNPDFGDQPQIPPGTDEPTLRWPNEDGPYLENFTPPDDIDDLNTSMLRTPAGTGFSSSEDISQLRNRVKVYGAGTTLAAPGVIGSSQIEVSDSSVFSVNGGVVMTGNGVLLNFFSTSALPSGNFLLLSQALTAAIPAGTSVQYYFQVDDLKSQRARGLIELDPTSGRPTDGIHEFVVNDTSLATAQQVYFRAHAEIRTFSNPITTIRYSTRDIKSRVGATVHVDLSNPPCFGDFLIQSVEIDQIQDDSPELTPRYTITASSIRYDLNNFLLALGIVGGGQSGFNPAPAAGIVEAAVDDVGSTTGVSIPIPAGSAAAGKRVMWLHCAGQAALVTVGQTAGTITGGSLITDSDGIWFRQTSSAGSQAQTTASFPFTRFELNPIFFGRFRTGGATFAARYLLGFNELGGINTDTPSNTSQRGVYLRYSSIAGDAGWRLMVVGPTTTVGEVFCNALRNTIYTVKLECSATAIVATMNFSGGTFRSTVTTNIVSGINLFHDIMSQGVTVPSTAATLDIESFYVESN